MARLQSTANSRNRWLFFVGIFIALIIGLPTIDTLATRGGIYPGVKIGSVTLGGATTSEASQVLNKEIGAFLENSLVFKRGSKQTSIPLSQLIAFDAEATITRAQEIGHTGNTALKLKERAVARLKGKAYRSVITVDEKALQSLLTQAFPEAHIPAKNAAFVFTSDNTTPTLTIQDETPGSTLDFESIASNLEMHAAIFENSPLELSATASAPSITREAITPLLPLAQEFFKKPAPIVTLEARSWTIPYTTLASWLTIGESKDTIAIDETKITAWLNTVAKDIEKPPINATFERTADGKKVAKFSIGTPGIVLPREKNTAAIAAAILVGRPLSLSVISSAPTTSDSSEAATLGIKELVGSGTTNFAGSPANRIKNIKRGAELLNGTLIAPGEEFSILEHLRPFTLENKYVPGLVIKAAEGKTAYEIGGGLCQIGTTMFRTVLNAGLPVTARSNHSYRVGYYEPPVGMDATIYDPAPDFKFLNDTGYWLLLTTRIEGVTATFELWGTKDGRTVALSEPVISNIRNPGPKKIIETTDLPPGVIKCTEKAHVGSDARFTSIVTYADGRVAEKEFKSRYRPWQEVCLLGVETLSPPVETPAAQPAAQTGTQTLPSADASGVTGDGDVTPFIAN